MGPQRRGAWTCASCKGNSTSRTKSNTSNTQSPSVGRANADGGNADVLFSQRFSKLEDLINKRMDDFQTSLDFNGKQMEDLAVAVKNVEKKNVLLEKRLNTQEAENQELKSRVKHLETMFHQREQKDQVTKMEISGFKDTKVDENQFVAKVMQAAGLNEEDIQFRVEKIVKEPMDKKGVKTQTLVVQFRTEATRNDVLAKIKSVIHININSLKAKWDELCIKLQSILPHLDVLIFTEIDVNSEQAVCYQLEKFHQINKCRDEKRIQLF
ncbi:hypothetical protein M8J75_011141 [Diaphorina citri]|nr:hypothetical protein M8J75_011141 [Diaphorina citri]